MPDWIHYLRERLDLPEMEGQKEERMLLEMADHAEDLYRRGPFLWFLSRGGHRLRRRAFGSSSPSHSRADPCRAGPPPSQDPSTAGTARRGPAAAAWPFSDSRRHDAEPAPFPSGAGQTAGFQWSRHSGAVAGDRIERRHLYVSWTLLSSRPSPSRNADRLVTIDHTAPDVGIASAGQCAAWHFTYEQENRVFEDLGLFEARSLDITGFGPPEAVPALGCDQWSLPSPTVAPYPRPYLHSRRRESGCSEHSALEPCLLEKPLRSRPRDRRATSQDRRTDGRDHWGDAAEPKYSLAGSARLRSSALPPVGSLCWEYRLRGAGPLEGRCHLE